MVFHTFGLPEKPTILLLHGAGLSWWAYEAAAEKLALDYRVVLPTLDGYGDAADTAFESIQASAQAVIRYVEEQCGGSVFALGGLSLGAQIATEVLSLRPGIARFAVLESALVCPIPGMGAMSGPLARMSYGLLRLRWFARWQASAMRLPDAMFDRYFADSLRMSKKTLENTLASNAAYRARPALSQVTARTLIVAGGREVGAMRKSAQALRAAIPDSVLWIAPGLQHGEWSLAQPDAFVTRLRAFFGGDSGDAA